MATTPRNLPIRNPKAPSWKDNLKAFKNLPPFLKLIWETNPYLTLATILLRLVKSGIPLAMLYIGKLIIDEVVDLIDEKSLDVSPELWQWIMIELALALLSDIFNRIITLVDALLGDLFANESSVRLMQHASDLDLAQFEDANFYDKLERARRQTTTRIVLMSQFLTQIQDLITMIFLAIGLVVFNPWLLLILALAVIPAFVNENYFNRFGYSLARSWTPERRELDYLRYIGASDETAKEIKSFGLGSFITKRFKKLAHDYYLANRGLAIKRAIFGSVFSVLGIVAYYGAYVVIVAQAVKGVISLGDLTFLAGSFQRIQGLLQGVLSRFSSIAQSALYLQDLFDFFEIEPEVSSPEKPKVIPEQIQKGFTFENVSFRYPNTDIWAVRNLSFHLNPGEKMALVGENGAGKTTLVKLLSRLYDPSEGRILLDGVDIREFGLSEYRRRTGIIFQDFVKFQFKVKENIAVGDIEDFENDDKMKEAAQRSLADTVIQNLPDKYEQMLGKRFANNGMELSGGQWQKVALGRAYMRDAFLLILDEPTAALDARAEYEVFERFSELTEGKTAVLISHRFSTVRMADRILVLKGGEIIELGSHQELLNKEGLYAELFQLQAQGYR